VIHRTGDRALTQQAMCCLVLGAYCLLARAIILKFLFLLGECAFMCVLYDTNLTRFDHLLGSVVSVSYYVEIRVEIQIGFCKLSERVL
jgi:hypothetical protein